MTSAEARRVAVRVPATSANLGPGFDSLGLALSWHDDIEIEVAGDAAGGEPPRLHIDVDGEGAQTLPRDHTHLVIRSLTTGFERLGAPLPGRVAVKATNRIPHGRGLGSSAAAITAGLVAARALVPDGEERLDDGALLALAAELEGHPDNVAACLLGGLTVAWTTPTGARAHRLEPAGWLTATVYVPGAELATSTARAALPATVEHAAAASNAGRTALLVAALTGPERLDDLLLAATVDRLHQEFRREAMPASLELVDRLRSAGVPAVISGAGPSVLAFGIDGGAAPAAPAGFTAYRAELDRSGATVRTS